MNLASLSMYRGSPGVSRHAHESRPRGTITSPSRQGSAVDSHEARRNEEFVHDRLSLVGSERRALFTSPSVASRRNLASPSQVGSRSSATEAQQKHNTLHAWQTSDMMDESPDRHTSSPKRFTTHEQNNPSRNDRSTRSTGLSSPILDEEASRNVSNSYMIYFVSTITATRQSTTRQFDCCAAPPILT
jgi:hypothetical protein